MIKVSLNYRLMGVCGDTVEAYTDSFLFNGLEEAKAFLQDKEPGAESNDLRDSAGLYELLDSWSVEAVTQCQSG